MSVALAVFAGVMALSAVLAAIDLTRYGLRMWSLRRAVARSQRNGARP